MMDNLLRPVRTRHAKHGDGRITCDRPVASLQILWLVFTRTNGADDDSPGLGEVRPWESNVLFDAPLQGAEPVGLPTQGFALLNPALSSMAL